MRLGIDVSQHQLSWDELLERVRWAEDAGFEGAWLFDHFKALYGDPSGPCLEGWTLMAALAAATEKIRIGSLVTGVTYRHPSILTTEAVTVDHISKGRLEFSLGAAWFDGEHHELGIEFPSNKGRAEMLEDGLNIYKKLCTTDGVDHDGKRFSLKNATYNPKPVQKPWPPIWIGASGKQLMLPIAGRHADVWHTYGPAGKLLHKWKTVAEHAEKAGRDPASIRRASNLSISEGWDEVRRNADELVEAGWDYLIVSWPGEGQGRVEEFMDKIGRELLEA